MEKEKNGKTKFYYLAILAILIFIGIFWWWRVYHYPYESTEDASISGIDLSISTLQAGQILQMSVDEGDVVKQGDLLFVLDDTLLGIEREQAVANLAHAKDEVDLQKIRLELARDDFSRARTEFSGGVISEEAMAHVEKNLQMAEAALQSIISLAGVQEAALKRLDTLIGVCQVTAPSDGVVAKRWHDAGDVVREGQTILSLVDLSQIWISANIEETKLASIHIGNPVQITVDAYPGLEFQGNVQVVGAAAASQFALIPQNNASGNFTKVTQRIPLKVSIQARKDAAALYLRPGMSVKVKIRVR